MSIVIHREAVVGPDGKIEISISAPGLRPGQRVAITIEPDREVAESADDAQARVDGPSIIDIIRESPGQQLFKTAAEVDEYLRQERDSWGD